MRKKILLFIIALIFTGCNRTDEISYLKILPERIECPEEGGVFEISVDGPDDWVTDNTANWIDIKRRNGQAIVTIAEDKGADRDRKIMFRSGNRKDTLEIHQSGKHVFSISETEIRPDYKGGTFPVTVECYEPWTVTYDCTWISTDISESSAPQEVNINISASQEKEARDTKVHFTCEDATLTLAIHQGPGPYIAVETETVESSGDGGTFNVLYISNTDVETSTQDSWIRLIAGLEGQKTVAFEVMRNMSDAREGLITLSSVIDPEYKKTITVRQGPKISHPALHFEEGYSMEISEKKSFVLHPVFTDMSDHSLAWSSDHPDIASVSDDGTVTVHTGGTCTITAENRFHKVSAHIELNIRIQATSMKIMLDSQDMEANPLAVRYPGEKLTVIPVMDPADAYTGDIVCISSDQSVAAVEGMSIRCIQPGTATISVESLYHGIRKSFSILILED